MKAVVFFGSADEVVEAVFKMLETEPKAAEAVPAGRMSPQQEARLQQLMARAREDPNLREIVKAAVQKAGIASPETMTGEEADNLFRMTGADHAGETLQA